MWMPLYIRSHQACFFFPFSFLQGFIEVCCIHQWHKREREWKRAANCTFSTLKITFKNSPLNQTSREVMLREMKEEEPQHFCTNRHHPLQQPLTPLHSNFLLPRLHFPSCSKRPVRWALGTKFRNQNNYGRAPSFSLLLRFPSEAETSDFEQQFGQRRISVASFYLEILRAHWERVSELRLLHRIRSDDNMLNFAPYPVSYRLLGAETYLQLAETTDTHLCANRYLPWKQVSSSALVPGADISTFTSDFYAA